MLCQAQVLKEPSTKCLVLAWKREIAVRQWTHKEHRTRSMVEDKAGDMAHRLRSKGRSLPLGRTWTDHKQIGMPFGGTIHNFTLRPTPTLQQFRCTYMFKIALSLFKNILGGVLLCLAHLLTS